MTREYIDAELDRLERSQTLRELHWCQSGPGRILRMEGRDLVNFGSNDYLGLATCGRLKKAASQAIDRWGTGAGASRLVGGNHPLYRELEEELARFKEAPAACVFATGYMANIALIQALAGDGALFCVDKLVHASIVDALRLATVAVRVWRHNDPDDLERALRARSSARRFVLTESVFSMDGCVAPLARIVEISRRFDADVIVDEAHATGVLGPQGKGLAGPAGIDVARDFVITTFSKGLGSLGGAVTGSEKAIRLIHNKARPLIFSTGLPPAVLAANLEALRLVPSLDEDRNRVLALAGGLRKTLVALGFNTLDSATQIIPVVLGEPQSALSLSRYLIGKGIFAPAVRPPAVPKGSARLRLSLTCYHQPEDIQRLIGALEAWKMGNTD